MADVAYWQELGRQAWQQREPITANPLYLADNLPRATGEPHATWVAKVAAWRAGWHFGEAVERPAE
jgi:hypothetical protein